MEFGWDPMGGWVDLRLGDQRVTQTMTSNTETETEKEEIRAISSSSSSVVVSKSASSKRTRMYYKAQQMVKCSVDDCNCDLRNSRDYHRRHRVCEMHSKTAVVSVKGKHQRFCQQCSRFHSLEEFDEFKRSCRRRLDGHNKRRRKPHPPPLYLASDHYTGPRLLQIGSGLGVGDGYYGIGNPCVRMWPKMGGEHTTYNRFTPILPKTTVLGSEREVPVWHHHQHQQVEANCTNNMKNEMELLEGGGEGGGFIMSTSNSDRALYLLSALQSSPHFTSMEESTSNNINNSCPIIPLQGSTSPQFNNNKPCVCPSSSSSSFVHMLDHHHNLTSDSHNHVAGMLRMPSQSDAFLHTNNAPTTSLTSPFFWD